MKKSITALACATLLTLSLSSLPFDTSAAASPQFDSPAAAGAPKVHKKKIKAKPGSKVKAASSTKAKSKAAGKVAKTKKGSKTKKVKPRKTKAKKPKAHPPA